MKGVALFVLYACLLVVGVSAYEGKLDVRLPSLALPHLQASTSLCGTQIEKRLQYHWPVKPFNVQHPVRGNFGDPRTLTTDAFGTDAADGPGDFSFHNGVDIAAPAGTKVYPVVSGWGVSDNGDRVVVMVGDREFDYRHIKPWLRHPQRVIAGVTVLGTIKHPADHVHLTEIDGPTVINPLTRLRPYVDHTKPAVPWVSFQTVDGLRLEPGAVGGRILVFAQAEDTQSIPVPGTWKGFPVTPAVVEATLVDARGVPVWHRVVSDVTRTEPVQADFWQVYGPGTYQNFPVFEKHYYYKTPGRYVFRITRAPLDTERLPNGNYQLEVSVRDVCGNDSTLAQPVRIDNGANGLERDAVHARRPFSS